MINAIHKITIYKSIYISWFLTWIANGLLFEYCGLFNIINRIRLLKYLFIFSSNNKRDFDDVNNLTSRNKEQHMFAEIYLDKFFILNNGHSKKHYR